ncbi:hypothetical protein CAPTEDRAFT_190638 [Capitella teleta]|uniref:MITD1 C-terminal phospholipase D-like domain-containing protein n=1 Tax=Capitella teleta TaxID=283909 RepID=R7UZE3_CAPTE|nr:hypothetical protein CAPTEDRAFT_190638 [Capitella teleta]|eukprot:ELU11627.1 hypothetical protein CAPTEDRAFT_190638 [Capitella teleta]
MANEHKYKMTKAKKETKTIRGFFTALPLRVWMPGSSASGFVEAATEVQLLQNENEDLRIKLEKSERQNRQLEKRAKESTKLQKENEELNIQLIERDRRIRQLEAQSTKGQLRKENDDLKEKISQMENELQRFAQSQRNNIEERVVSTTLDTNLSSLASPTQVTDQEQVLPPLNCYREKIWIPDDSTWYGYLNIFKTPFKYQTKKVLVVDPYIQQSYQIENFESFCFDLVHKTKMGLRKITLMTCKANEGNTRQEQRLMSFGKDWLEKRYGIKLEIRWVDDKLLHRRHIE